MKTSKKFTSAVESFDMCDTEDNGFIEGNIDLGKAITCFNFGGNRGADNNNKTSEEPKPQLIKSSASSTPATNIFRTSNNGLTPTVDGEPFTIKRGYQFRPSTIRKLHELKAKHPDVNVYLNTIIDEAINHYYNYILNQKSS